MVQRFEEVMPANGGSCVPRRVRRAQRLAQQDTKAAQRGGRGHELRQDAVSRACPRQQDEGQAVPTCSPSSATYFADHD
eukprot:2739239-Rhodomonas_salina.2